MNGQAKGQPFGAALFPFLAVLICTTGALAVLLVSALNRTGVESPLITAAQENEQDRALRERLEDAQWRRELLEKSRAEKTEELSETRSRVAHLAEHTQRLAAQAAELLERAKAIDEGKKLREEDFAAARAEADRLKAEIAKKKAELEKTKKPQDGQEWYALIPYDGRAGTRRRPIYVECTEFGVIIQPEGVLLRAEDFNGPLGPGNPLDSALRAIREHWEKSAGSNAGQPYPLLVVRPSGVVAFGAAKAAIGAWDDEWGYELISDDKHLDFGQPDPALNATLSKTVAVSRQRQAAIVAMMPRRFQGDEPLKSFTPEPSIAAGSSRYIGGGSGGTAGGGGLGGGFGAGTGGNGAGASGVGGQPGGGMARTNGGYGNGFGAGTGAGGGSGYAAGGTGPGANGTNGNAGPGTGGNGAAGTGAGGSNGGGTGGAGAGGNGIPSVTSSLNGGAAGQSDSLAGRNAASALGNTGSGGAGGEGFLGSSAGGGGPGGSSYGAGGNGPAGSSGGQAGGGQNGSAAGGQSFAGGGSGGQSGGSMGNSNSGGGGASSFGSAGASNSAPGGAGSPFGGSSMASSSGGMGVPSLNFGGASSSQPAGASKTGPGGPNSTAKRGKNWGLPQAKQNQTGVTRLIRVNLQPDRVVMLPEAGDNRAPQVVKIAPEMTPDDVNHFVSAVQSEVKGWGLAVADGYWKPKLQVEVAPGAERQYLNLETALNGSGIEIIRR